MTDFNAREGKSGFLRYWRTMGCSVALIVVLGFVWHEVALAQSMAKGSSCSSNLSEGAHALLIYASDWDDRLPLASRWMEADETRFNCPSVREESADGISYGVAYNLKLSAAKIASFGQPSKTAFLFDSTLNERNASSGIVTLPTPGRHESHGPSNTVSFLDGHAVRVRDAERATMLRPGEQVLSNF